MFPAADDAIKGKTPVPGTPGYDQAIIDFVQATAPNSFVIRALVAQPGVINPETLSYEHPDGVGRALLPLVVAVDPAERDAVVRELKAAQRGYLEPIFAGRRLKVASRGR